MIRRHCADSTGGGAAGRPDQPPLTPRFPAPRHSSGGDLQEPVRTASALMRTILLLVPGTVHGATRAERPERIAPDNAHRLAVAWTYDTRDPIESLAPGGDAPLFEATPVYSEGRLDLATPKAPSRRSTLIRDARSGVSTFASGRTPATASTPAEGSRSAGIDSTSALSTRDSSA